MTGGLFDAITQKHGWETKEIRLPTLDQWIADGGRQEVYERHKEALAQAERFVKDCKRNPYPQENDRLYELLFWWSWEQRAGEVKNGKLPEHVAKMCMRFDRGSLTFRDYVFELIGRL